MKPTEHEVTRDEMIEEMVKKIEEFLCRWLDEHEEIFLREALSEAYSAGRKAGLREAMGVVNCCGMTLQAIEKLMI